MGTCVCNIPGSDSAPMVGLPRAILSQPILGSVFSPLPPASYHVTSLDICTKYEDGLDDEGWRAKLNDPRWAFAAEELKRAEVRPSLVVERVLILPNTMLVELKSAHNDTVAHPRDLPVNSNLVRLLGLKKNQLHVWHFTLGYCHRPDKLKEALNSDPKAVEQDRLSIEAAVRKALPGVLPMDISLLCKFGDMTAFTPW